MHGLGLESELQLGVRIESGARIRERTKNEVKFMGKAGVRCMSIATVWVNLVARTGDTERFRVRPRVSHKFQAVGRAWASVGYS